MKKELQDIIDSKKNPIARDMLEHLFSNDSFKENMCAKLEQLVAKQRAKVGLHMTSEQWVWGDDNELEAGIGSALMHLVRTAAVRTAASGLGTSPSTINKFTRHLTAKPK